MAHGNPNNHVQVGRLGHDSETDSRVTGSLLLLSACDRATVATTRIAS